MLCFSLGCFSTLQYQLVSAAQSLGVVRVTEMKKFFAVSEARANSPAEAQIIETQMDQQLPSVSHQDMAKHKLNEV